MPRPEDPFDEPFDPADLPEPFADYLEEHRERCGPACGPSYAPAHDPAHGPAHGPTAGDPTICLRATERQATSAVAHIGLPPDPDDPLLQFKPYRHKQPRANSITPDLQRAFVAHLAATGIVTSAALAIGKSMEALYKLRKMPGAEGFAEAWDEAAQWGILRLEDCAIERAMAQGLYNTRANSMLAFVLNYRRSEWVDVSNLEAGHPVYEAIRREVLEELGREPDPASGD
ncbi:hypothetical protein EH31_03905 [Erythrobacter longus]|uniref:Uncharacterized protein n=1 Tax=Erythrobacter longus TaxID=1044 RepID=A0A074N1M5_ERYLO|nr:hypothetical protein [Erythrobacter longus]KEO91827.1 hypothetical protein EH31_03905 [Erythrobacter longus]